VSTTTGFRLSPQQLRLWSHQMTGLTEPFRSRCALVLNGELAPAHLEQALRGLLAKHEILRTTYRPLPGTSTAVQLPGDVPATVLARHDWGGLSEQEACARLETLPVEAFPFHLATLGPRRHLLAIELSALSADQRTLVQLAREIGEAYAALQRGGQVSDADVQYADVAEVFNQLLEAEDTGAGRKYWQERSLTVALGASLPHVLSPASRKRLFQPRSERLTLAPETLAAVEAAARRAEVPVATFLLACWQLLLSRLSGSTAWTLAVRYHGRTYEGLDTALGLFERYLPLHGEHAPHTRFSELLREVARSLEDTAEWQDYFDAASGLSTPGPDGLPCFFPFAFEEQAWPDAVHAGGLTFTVARMDAHTERFELKLATVRRDASVELVLYHDASSVGPEQVSRLLERLEVLVRSAAAFPELAVDALPLIGAVELERLAGFNRTERPAPPERCIHEQLDEQTRWAPERLAVVFEQQRLTYAELSARANQLAWLLRERGVGPEVRVGLFLERSVDALVGLLGILKAGGAYVPLDPMYPHERLGSILQQADATHVVTRAGLSNLLPPGVAHPICLDTEAEALARAPDTAPETGVRPDNLAYVLFTSGSTGRPKGVMIQHRSVLNLAEALHTQVYESRGPGLRVSVNAPLVFDASVKQWIQLLYGHTLHIVPEELRPDAGRLCDWVRTNCLDVLDCTPSLLVPMLEKGLGREPGVSPVLVLVGGEALDGRSWAELARRERTRFVNVYGPTECTVDATACAASESREPTIGGALPNMRVHLLDRHLRPVPLGVAGELFIGGAGVGRGYVGQPSLTAERFVPDPFGPPGARLYRTGDLGRYREDGRIDFIGRADHQVKLRGFRIEMGEIEACIRQHPEVGETVALVREKPPGEARLVAYFVPRRGVPAGTEAHARQLSAEVRDFLRQILPEYMVPSTLVPLDRMPLNRNGKLDRSALPDPHTAMADSAPHEAPTNSFEQTIADIWRVALKVDKVGRHANFFDLGGHSLLMVQVHERLSAAFGRRFSMVELFQHPTVAALAKYIGQAQTPETAAQDATREVHDERARKQRQAMEQQALRIKAGRGKR